MNHGFFEFVATYEGTEEQMEMLLNNLPFGIIQLDKTGIIRRYNHYESELSGYEPGYAVGKNFFDLAPCVRVGQFREEFERAIQTGELDVVFRAHFPFPKRPRQVEIHLYYSKAIERVWCLVIDESHRIEADKALNRIIPFPGKPKS